MYPIIITLSSQRENIMPKGTTKLLAEFVEESLAGMGVMDDADELIGY